MCFESGGGAFLIPYFITLLLVGIPLLYLELAVGQLTRAGPVHAIAALCPLMTGVGVATVVMTFLLASYYNVIITWAIYYLFKSFTFELPWYSCDKEWASENCTELASGLLYKVECVFKMFVLMFFLCVKVTVRSTSKVPYYFSALVLINSF